MPIYGETGSNSSSKESYFLWLSMFSVHFRFYALYRFRKKKKETTDYGPTFIFLVTHTQNENNCDRFKTTAT